ncbi:hypothetical protein ABE073_05080 [Lederbergia citrisecunda]|uniref:hypothetical protein n=1 Tax=Lederbergia citrisecunda TaxID=2833583 RepID=UPI003D2B160E
MLVIKAVFTALLITMGIWLYHTIQFHRKKNKQSVSVGIVTKHELKSEAYFIASFGLMALVLVFSYIYSF